MLLCLDHLLRCPINEASEIDLFSSYDFDFLISNFGSIPCPFKLTCTNLYVKVAIYLQFCPKYPQYAPSHFYILD